MSKEKPSVPRWLATSPLVPGPLDSPPPSGPVEAVFGARSRRGLLRSANDDHYLILRLGRHQETLLTSLPDNEIPERFDEYAYGMVVADGMGRAGETASRLAISTLVHLGIYFGKFHVRVDEPIAEEMVDRAQRFYRSIDSTLVKASQNSSSGLQSTLTAVYTAGNELFFAHVGRSRAYVFRDGELMQLTHDHTVILESPGRPALGKAGAAARVDIERCGLLDGDTILLCTNGLTDMVKDAQIATVLESQGTPDEQSAALVDLAITAGGSDDVTALVAHYRFRP